MFLVWWRCGDLPYSDCYRRSIACSRRGSHGDAVLRFFKIAINPRFGIKKGTAFAVPFFVFNIRKSYTKDIAIMLCFYKKRKKNQEYYPGLFSYYICTEYPTK